MATQKVIIGFSRYKDAALNQKANHILGCMTGNAHFPTPTPKLADVETANANYGNALAKAVDGTKQDTVLKNQARAALETVLAQLGLYVQLNSNNDPAIMLSSGFDISEEHSPIGVLAKL